MSDLAFEHCRLPLNFIFRMLYFTFLFVLDTKCSSNVSGEIVSFDEINAVQEDAHKDRKILV